jgi:hypothetical protein
MKTTSRHSVIGGLFTHYPPGTICELKKKPIFALHGIHFSGRSSTRSGKRRPPVRAGFSFKESNRGEILCRTVKSISGGADTGSPYMHGKMAAIELHGANMTGNFKNLPRGFSARKTPVQTARNQNNCTYK